MGGRSSNLIERSELKGGIKSLVVMATEQVTLGKIGRLFEKQDTEVIGE